MLLPSISQFVRIARRVTAGLIFGLVMMLPLSITTDTPLSSDRLVGNMAHAATQAGWVGDIPLMEGLQVEPELGFSFDSPSGRIVMIFASTDRKSTEIRAFYAETLGNLGWNASGDIWVRDEETLSISQVPTAVGMLWRIMLRPK